ncbi:hypothetical protein E4U41_006751 [Claviceps citrina]|nr:hypothetical protein E4U41_006751 [Claviceps citrina]
MDVHATAPETPRSLMSSQSRGSQLQIVVHPLVLLGMSDHVSRHFIRGHGGPVVGAILGQQTGREITMEHTFECHLMEAPGVEGGYLLQQERFTSRLEQMITVHKDRNLDFVGWYTLVPSTGPRPTDLPIHKQILDVWNDSAILLGFHCSDAGIRTIAGKTPATMYETIYEVEDAKTGGEQDGEDRTMQDGESAVQLRFREVPYNIETDETELISMNYVAAGTGNASATSSGAREDRPSRSAESAAGQGRDKGKGKRRLVEEAQGGEAEAEAQPGHDNDYTSVALTREEDEMIAALTAKANALKMLHCRIRLLTTYLKRLPPSLVNGHGDGHTSSHTSQTDHTTPSFRILRQIRALVNRLDLVVPANKKDFEAEMDKEANNVHLVNLLSSIMQSLSGAREVGKKFSIVEAARASPSGSSSSVTSRSKAAFEAGVLAALSFRGPGTGNILV